MIDGAFYVDGKVVLRYYQPIPKHVKVGNKDYIFQCGHGISLIFVPEEEVLPLLNFLGGCCGGRKKVISLGSQVLYSHWLDGQGGR